ncbi:hypothetical protein MUB16_02210 [Priestia sp. OVL9]|nr:hypothetical protein [Priestia sp. OVL9]
MQGPIAGGVSLLNPTTIFIENGGDYRVNFVITDNTVVFGPNPSAFPHLPTVALFLNNVQVLLEQANFGLEITQAEGQVANQLLEILFYLFQITQYLN